MRSVMRRDVDVAVVGAGLMGAATAWALARRGVPVALLEAHEPGHRHGSSHGSARIFRRAYRDPLYVELAGRARDRWQLLEREADEVLLRRTGGLDHGGQREPQIIAGALRTAGVPAALLSAREAELRWPGLTFAGPVLFQPDAGVIDADRAVAAMVRCAVDAGAAWYPRTQVGSLERVAAGVKVQLPDRRPLLAAVVVLAAGAWLAPLLARSGMTGPVGLPRLTVTQEQAFRFPVRDRALTWPVFLHHRAPVMYGLPAGRDGADTVKVGEHLAGPVTTADARSGVVDPAARQRVIDYVRRHLPGLDPAPAGETTCLYTSTDNGDFVLDRVGPLVVCSPCSGHGAKFAPVIGELAAGLATGSPASSVPVRFSLAAHRPARDGATTAR
jgi:glycine/D-amino acid oxidase-like deaminating enzyme